MLLNTWPHLCFYTLFNAIYVLALIQKLICRNSTMKTWTRVTRRTSMPKPGMCLGVCGLEKSSTVLVRGGSALSTTRCSILSASVSSSMQLAALRWPRRNQAATRRSILHSVAFCRSCLDLVAFGACPSEVVVLFLSWRSCKPQHCNEHVRTY